MTVSIPIVSIVGRQNVGKSTLFNSLIRRKKSIVDAMPGLTRDIISCRLTHREATFELCDTPGLDISDPSELSRAILENAQAFLKRSSVVILLLENPAPSSFDYTLAELVRKLGVPSIIAVNKMDRGSDYENLSNFYDLGFDDILPISALRRDNITLMLDKIFERLPVRRLHSAHPDLRIAIVGRPNSGKSTLLNALIGYERSVVSAVPGTTRDSVDEEFGFQGKRITVIDTAGIRKKSRIKDDIDFYSHARTVESIARSNVVLHLLDAGEGLTETDKKIADEVLRAHKPFIIAINKWDMIEKDRDTFKEFKDRLVFKFYRAADFPVISVSARDKLRIHRLITTALELHEKAGLRIATPRLNKIVEDLQRSHRIPSLGERLKIFYITQTAADPPHFKVFVNNPEFFRRDVVRHLEKALQASFNLNGVPLVLSLEGRRRRS